MDALFGRYRLLEKLGQGGMAEVFKAKSYGVEGFEKILVIKRILPELALNQDFVDMFIHEAKLAVRLSHANIVQVFDLGKADSEAAAGGGPIGAYYIAMEYVHGLDLASALARSRRSGQPCPMQMGVYIASEVAKALDHAHRRRDEKMRPLGIVHRDVSPQNVLLSFEGEVKVTDFGIAKARGAVDKSTSERALQGKLAYMSPEQARGDLVDARSDLFSLGTLLYECVAGVNPFHAPTTFETLRRVQACQHPPVELLRPDIAPELRAILTTSMAKVPADRFPSAGSMYEALLAFLYSQRSRYGAHDLAELLSRLREPSERPRIDSGRPPLLETDAPPPPEPTPTEVPSARSAPRLPAATADRHAAIDRAAGMGERRDVTGLVIDLPREAHATVISRAANLIERWGGRVLRRDSALAAVFGLDDPDGRDAEMATRCALVALRSLEPTKPPGIGLHIGRIHVSASGHPTEDEQLVRLLDTARDLARVREGRVAVSTAAMRQIKAFFDFEPITDSDKVADDVSGVIVEAVRGPRDAFGRFVGRKDELRKIGEALAVATRRKSRVITIRGDNGIGKTRLLYEVERRLRKGGYNVGFHTATCPPRGNEFPLSGIVCMLQVLCGTSEGDSDARIVAVQPRLRALGLQDEEVNAVLAALGAAVPSPRGDANARLRQAFVRMVQSLCEDRTHALAWDVAHAMDEDSFSLLEEVRRRLKQSRLVIALAARAGFSHPLETADGHVAIDLGDLAPGDVERLVAVRLGVDAAPEELLRFVRARAGGHPLFAEEVIKGLVDAGAIVVAERRVVSMKLVGQDLALPRTLRGLVASRVARLAPAERSTLQAACVLGDPIDTNVLARMLGRAMSALEKSVGVLKERDFIVDRAPTGVGFASPIVPEIVADALTPEAAREMHAAAGRALEASDGPHAPDHAARIARHLYEAGDRERAASCFARSGERRLSAGQLEAAARDYAHAIVLASVAERPTAELAKWIEDLALAVRVVRSVPDAADVCQRVTHPVDKGGTRAERVRVRVAAGHILASVEQMSDSRRCLAEAKEIAGLDEPLLKPVLVAEVELSTRKGHFRHASEVLDELHRIVRSKSDDHERHRVALHLAQATAALGDRAKAVLSLVEAEKLLPDDRAALVERTRVRALVDHFTRDFRSAAANCEKAIELGRELGLSYEVMVNLHNLGAALIYLGDLPRAYGAFQQSLTLCEEGSHERLGNTNRMFLAFLDGLQGTADGEGLLRQGIAYAESKDFTWDVIGGQSLLAKLLDQRGSAEDARDAYEKARTLAMTAGHHLIAEDCERALAALDGRAPQSASAS